MLKLTVCAAAVCLLSPCLVPAQAPDSAMRARLDEVARSYTKNNAFMGTVLVVQGDEVLLDKGYGMANLDWSISNTPDVKFRLGSLTKQFTAALILLEQQDGKLSIADPVSKYLPDAPKAWEKITVAELLGHTSGIPNFTSDPAFGVWRLAPHTPAEELAFFSAKPLDFEPGSKYSYSNSNYEVLGDILEKVSGKSYNDLLRQRLFDPLGMKDTGLDGDDLILPKRASGYAPGPAGLIYARSESMTVPWAAGSLYSTTHDLLTWERGLFGGKVLSAASLKLMTTPGKGNYGLGVEVAHVDGVTVINHGGGIEGFNTHLSHVPEKDITVVVLSNVSGGAPSAMAPQLVSVALGKPVVLAAERKAVPITHAELTRFEGAYNLGEFGTFTFTTSGDTLMLGAFGPPSPLLYQGLKNGHPTFFFELINGEIEFVPDAAGAVSSLILHFPGQPDAAGKRK
jgi:CubicO group peptidase (beta-lactamase class C family)